MNIMIYGKFVLKSPKEILINDSEYITFSYTLGAARFPIDTNDMRIY